MDELSKRNRYFLQDKIRLETDFSKTGQALGVPAPPVEKPFPSDAKRYFLPGPAQWQQIKDRGLIDSISNRKSRRKYLQKPLSQEELAFLCWTTQGIRRKVANIIQRTVPSAGNRHAFETYICALNVSDLEKGIYRYLPLEHELLLVTVEKDLDQKTGFAALGQSFIGTAAAVFIWTAIPYRMEWRYGKAAHKVIAIDAGHVCQNLYLACEAIGCGTCAIAAYNQKLMDELIKVDGEEEFTVYLAPVGKVL